MKLNERSIVFFIGVIVLVPMLSHALPSETETIPEPPPRWEAPWKLSTTGGECRDAITQSDDVGRKQFEARVQYMLVQAARFDDGVHLEEVAHYIRSFPEIPTEAKQELLNKLSPPHSFTSSSQNYRVISLGRQFIPLLVAVSLCEALDTDRKIQVLQNITRFMYYISIADEGPEREEQRQKLKDAKLELTAFLWAFLFTHPTVQKIYEEHGGEVPYPSR